MEPGYWGPHYWFVLHTVSFQYPKKPTFFEKKVYQDFYTSLKHLLPCGTCREHYAELLKEYPIAAFLESREQLVRWVNMIHNKVNEKLGKPEMDIATMLEKYRREQEEFRANKQAYTHRRWIYLFFPIAILAVVAILVVLGMSWIQSTFDIRLRKYIPTGTFMQGGGGTVSNIHPFATVPVAMRY